MHLAGFEPGSEDYKSGFLSITPMDNLYIQRSLYCTSIKVFQSFWDIPLSIFKDNCTSLS